MPTTFSHHLAIHIQAPAGTLAANDPRYVAA